MSEFGEENKRKRWVGRNLKPSPQNSLSNLEAKNLPKCNLFYIRWEFMIQFNSKVLCAGFSENVTSKKLSHVEGLWRVSVFKLSFQELRFESLREPKPGVLVSRQT